MFSIVVLFFISSVMLGFCLFMLHEFLFQFWSSRKIAAKLIPYFMNYLRIVMWQKEGSVGGMLDALTKSPCSKPTSAGPMLALGMLSKV